MALHCSKPPVVLHQPCNKSLAAYSGFKVINVLVLSPAKLLSYSSSSHSLSSNQPELPDTPQLKYESMLQSQHL